MTKLGYKLTKEHKNNISKAHIGKHRSEEQKKNMSKAQRGNTNMLGRIREKSSRWKGGFTKNKGRILFKVPEGCRFSSMKDSQGYISMSRLIMAECLQRPLTDEEVVHHENGDITDNRRGNLRLFRNDKEHTSYHNKLRKEIILI